MRFTRASAHCTLATSRLRRLRRGDRISSYRVPAAMPDRVPALVVSGFLGSGKTSLVRHLLDQARRQGVRLAVVSNEFGDLGIDAELLSRGPGDYVEISGGCVCCRLSDELVSTLQELRERADPDRVVIETSGLALPFETQLQLWREPIGAWIEDDVAVVVVNAEQLAAGRDLDDTFEQQVSSADLLLLNQVDRVAEDRLAGLEAELRTIEPEAPIVQGIHGQIPPDLLFPPDPQGVRAMRRGRSASRDHRHQHFETRIEEIPDGAAPAEVVESVRALAALRVKGFVRTREGLRLVQAVGPRVDLHVAERAPRRAPIGRLVVIRRVEAPR
jgi:cobalamin biosynthesis protein CobW